MKKFEVLTTSMRKIVVQCGDHDEAIKIASSQFKGNETTMMVSNIIS